jgi:phenylacetate-coenzyme A ligase PaaK-like adenylate-forming protein
MGACQFHAFMAFMTSSMKKEIQQFFLKQAFRFIRHQLRDYSAGDIQKQSLKCLFRSFRIAYQQSDAYRTMVNEALGASGRICSGSDVIRRAPIIDKNSFFASHTLGATHPKSTSSLVGRIWSSSGSTNVLSLGFEKPRSSLFSLLLDFMLDFFFQTLSQRTVLINGLPGGWPIPVKTLQVSNIGTRTDIGVSLLMRLRHDVDQFIVCMEPLLAKQLIEDALKNSVDFGTTKIHFIIGGEYASEHLRQYLYNLINPHAPSGNAHSQNHVLLSMGFSEFGVSIFFETPSIAALRSALFHSGVRPQDLFGSACSFMPQIFQYNPLSTFIESVDSADGNSSLVLSSLHRDADVPLIRYRTGDTGLVFSHDDIYSLFKSAGIDAPIPIEFPFPFVVTQGRSTAIKRINGSICDLSSIKEALYASNGLLPFITGYFSLTEGRKNDSHPIEVQLKEGFTLSDIPEDEIESAAARLSAFDLSMKFVPYFKFTQGMGHLFDRKFAYVQRKS